MMNKFLTLLFASMLFLPIGLFAQSDTIVINASDYKFNSYHSNKTQYSFYLKSHPDSVLNGNFRLLRSNNWVEEFCLNNNMVDGVNYIYYSGVQTQERNYKNGWLHGKHYIYHDQKDEKGNRKRGSVYKDDTYSFGLQVDTAFVFDRNKWLVSYTYFNDKGNEHGLHARFYAGVKLQLSGYYKDGKQVGEWRYLREDGSLQNLTFFDPISDRRNIYIYYQSGNVHYEKHFEGDVYVGRHECFDELGGVVYSQYYENGFERGKQIKHRYNLTEKYTINNKGQFDGEYEQIDDVTKKIRVKGRFRKGLKAGKWTINLLEMGEVRELEFVDGENKLFEAVYDDRNADNNREIFTIYADYFVPLNNVNPSEKQKKNEPKLFLFSE